MRWGIVGTGAIAHRFAEALAKVPGASIAAVAARRPEAGAAFAARFGAGTVVADAAALAVLGTVDVVYIATPNHRHKPDALAVIAGGKPLLCEKPLACDAAEAAEIVGAARAAGLFCMEGIWSLCLPVYREAFARIRAGAIGEVREIVASFAVPEEPYPGSRLFDPAQGGGALLDRGVYLIALAGALIGDMRLAGAWGTLDATGATDAAVRVLFEGENGASAYLSAGIDRFAANEFTVVASAGRCTFAEPITCPPSYRLVARPPRGPEDPARGSGGKGIAARLKQNPQVRRWARALASDARWMAGGLEDEIRTVERSIAQGLTESVEVPLDTSLRIAALMDEIGGRIGVRG